jgi:hypothetical protein
MANNKDLVIVTDKDQKSLFLFNLIMGVLHVVQGLAMLYLSKDFKLPVNTNYLGPLPVAGFDVIKEKVFDVQIGPMVASFLFMSAIAHFLIITPGIFAWYLKNIKAHANYARWIEYSISSSVMVVIIGLLCGVYDLGALIALFSLNAIMNLFGLVMERNYQKFQHTDWLSYVLGCFAGLVPWIVITMHFLGAAENSNDAIPSFVYIILISLFVTFNVFAINMFLQYKKVGPWKDYLFGEKAFILLSLIAKSLLAWQVFSGTLR